MELSTMMIGPEDFTGSILLIIAILLGAVATVMTLINSRKLKGEVFEKPFIFTAVGFFLVTFSLFSVTFLTNLLGSMKTALVHDVSFILGLGLILFASMRVTKFLITVDNVANKIKK